MALGEAHSVLIPHQFAVIVPGYRQAQGSIQQNLAGGGFQQVGAADDFSDLHGGIIDYYGQLIGGDIIFSPDDEVAEIFAGHQLLRTQVQINERNFFSIGDAKTPVHSGGGASLRFGSTA